MYELLRIHLKKRPEEKLIGSIYLDDFDGNNGFFPGGFFFSFFQKIYADLWRCSN